MGLRVGIDASNLRGGGGVTHLRSLLAATEPARDSLEEVRVWGGKATLDRVIAEGDWLHKVHVPLLDRGLLARLLWRRAFLSRLADRNCDILFIPGGMPGRSKIPWVVMCRNMLPFDAGERQRYGWSPGRLRLEGLRYAHSKSFRCASGLIFLTEYARREVLGAIGQSSAPVAVIAHGVEPRFRRVPARARSLADCTIADPLRLLYVSTVNLYKHQWHVAQAVAQLREQGLPVSLELVGGGVEPAISRLRAMLEHIDPKGEFVQYRGPVAFEELHVRYQDADAFVFASSCENMPNILLEAMAAGLPIACSDRGPMPEILGDCGEYFDPESAASIAGALRRLLEDRARAASMAARVADKAEAYSWELCATQTFEFLHEVCRASRSS